MRRVWGFTLDVNGPNVDGDVQVTGFCTERTALKIAARFADALREEYPGAVVRAFVTREPVPTPADRPEDDGDRG